MFGAKIPEKCEVGYFIKEGEQLILNDAVFDVLFTPPISGSVVYMLDSRISICKC